MFLHARAARFCLGCKRRCENSADLSLFKAFRTLRRPLALHIMHNQRPRSRAALSSVIMWRHRGRVAWCWGFASNREMKRGYKAAQTTESCATSCHGLLAGHRQTQLCWGCEGRVGPPREAACRPHGVSSSCSWPPLLSPRVLTASGLTAAPDRWLLVDTPPPTSMSTAPDPSTAPAPRPRAAFSRSRKSTHGRRRRPRSIARRPAITCTAAWPTWAARRSSPMWPLPRGRRGRQVQERRRH